MAEDRSWAGHIPSLYEVPVNQAHQPNDHAFIDDGLASSNLFSEHLQRLCSLTEAFAAPYSKLTTVRDEVMGLRNDGIYERQECSYRRDFFMKSQAELTKCLESPLSPTERLGKLRELQQQLEEDREALKAQDERALQVELELTRKEYYLRGKEATLASICDQVVTTLRQVGLVSLDDDLKQESVSERRTDPSRSTNASSPAIPRKLEDYYEKVGAVGWRKERVVELQMEYEEARIDRQFRKDHEEQLEASDEDFEAEHRTRILEARVALEKAMAEAKEARAVFLARPNDTEGHQSQLLDDASNISILPATINAEDNEPVGRRNRSVSAAKHVSDQHMPPLTLLRTAIDPEDVSRSSNKRTKTGSQSSQSRIADWMEHQEHVEQYPFEYERFMEPSDSRPVAPSRRSLSGPLDDYHEHINVDSGIEIFLPQQLRDLSGSWSGIDPRRGGADQVHRSRSYST